ncbi:redoxin family protein [Spirillospora sp. NBC_00431]
MKKLGLAIFAAFALAACGGDADEPVGAAPSTAASAPATTSTSAPGKAAPAVLRFKGSTLGGKPFDGTSLAGKRVVFWFWAPWCPKCQTEGPAVAKAAQKYAGQVVFVGVAGLDKSKPQMDRFVARTGTSGIIQLDDRTGDLYKHFKVTSQSSYLFVAPDGGTDTATGPLDDDELSALVDRHTR